MIKAVTVAMLGARRHYAVPRMLHEAGRLERFYTDSYAGNKDWLRSLLEIAPPHLRPRPLKRWLGRTEPRLPSDKVRSFEALGVWYAWKRTSTAASGLGKVSCEVAQRFARSIGREGFGDADCVLGFNTASVEIFAEAKRQGRICLLDQTILPRVLMDRLMAEEYARWPNWRPEGTAIPAADPISAERERLEWALADHIVAGSHFVRDGLLSCGVPAEKVSVVPYGVEPAHFAARRQNRQRRPGDALRVLFVGAVCVRKGAPYLLEALSRFNRRKLVARFAGGFAEGAKRNLPRLDHVEYLGAVPRMELPKLLEWADVFVLPSIVEGSATASYEALMSGLPCIVTPNTGSIVEDEVEGFVVPAKDADAIHAALRTYCCDGPLHREHTVGAIRSRDRASIKRYSDDLMQLLDRL